MPEIGRGDGDGRRIRLLSALANEMVRLHKEQFGRGPTKARAEWAGNDTLIVILEDTLAPAERNLARMGEHQRLRDVRMCFQYATVAEFCRPVEQLTGRTVRAFISGIDTEVDGLTTEVFVLHAVATPGRRAATPPSYPRRNDRVLRRAGDDRPAPPPRRAGRRRRAARG